MTLLAAALALTCSASPGGRPLVPFFVPRDVSFSVQVMRDAVSPTVRLGWQVTLIDQPRNHLLAVAHLGTGAGASLPTGLRALYQHVALGGIAYQSPRDRLLWGFKIELGAMWYRASYDPAERLRFENRVVGYSEGRLELALRLGPHLFLGVQGGFGAAWEANVRFPASSFLGGPFGGLFLDWR